MITIHKYPFTVAREVIINMPQNADVIKVDVQGNTPCLWAIVDTEELVEARLFHIFGTGQSIDKGLLQRLAHVSTFQANEGYFVWHMFSYL